LEAVFLGGRCFFFRGGGYFFFCGVVFGSSAWGVDDVMLLLFNGGVFEDNSGRIFF